MGNRKCHHLGNSGMLHEHVINFPGRNLFAPTVNDLLETARDEQVPISIQKPLIPCLEPPIGEGTFVGCWIILIALSDVRTTDDNLALATRWQHVTHVVHHGNLWTRLYTH